MTPDEAITQAKRIMEAMRKNQYSTGAAAEAKELVRVYAGGNSIFLQSLSTITAFTSDQYKSVACDILNSFISSIESGIIGGISPERKAKNDVISDLLDQANNLINTNGIHPAAPAVIAGAALEEFLRNWVEEINESCKNHNIEAYANILRTKDLITKQDMKDITSWAGIRNSAAHGKWEDVSDKKRIQLMFESISLFMRKYSERPSDS